MPVVIETTAWPTPIRLDLSPGSPTSSPPVRALAAALKPQITAEIGSAKFQLAPYGKPGFPWIFFVGLGILALLIVRVFR